jgi:putative DNA primase/helicase
VELLQDIQEVVLDKHINKVKSRDLIDYLCEDDMRPWATYNRGKPLSPRQLANRLSEYGIEPKTIRFPNGTAKGYERDQFEDAFHRYIPSTSTPDLSVTPEQNPSNADPQRDTAVTDMLPRYGTANSVTEAKNKGKQLEPIVDKACHSVTDTAPLTDDVEVF